MTLRNAKMLHRQSGLTLVEIMVALAIGSFLIIGAVQIQHHLLGVAGQTAHKLVDEVIFDGQRIGLDLLVARGAAGPGRR